MSVQINVTKANQIMATKDHTTNDITQRTPEPVITYDHMERASGLKIKSAGDMPVWSFVIEEITIIGLLAALYLSL